MRGPIIFLALPLVAACAGGEGFGNGVAVEEVAPIVRAVACPVLASRLLDLSSVYEGPGDTEVILRASAVQAAGVDCAGPQWETALAVWRDAQAR